VRVEEEWASGGAGEQATDQSAVQKSAIRNPQSAILSVRDTGIGIEPELLLRIFDTFTQADRSLDRTRGGLGLGLALVKGLAALHGGEARASSEGAGRGAEFTILLPLTEAEPVEWPVEIQAGTLPGTMVAPATVEGAGVGAAPAPAMVGARPLRLLVIEDNRDSVEMVCLMLEMYGHQTEAAYTGKEGVEAALRSRPDAVVCDIGLPEMDGYEVARKLRAAGYTGRLMAVSGYGREEDKQMSHEAGFDFHLTKPVEPEQLNLALQEMIRR
jgi:CheY-like chemotaxis protein